MLIFYIKKIYIILLFLISYTKINDTFAKIGQQDFHRFS